MSELWTRWRESPQGAGEAGNPEFDTVMRIVGALDVTLSARPATWIDIEAAQGRLNGGEDGTAGVRQLSLFLLNLFDAR